MIRSMEDSTFSIVIALELNLGYFHIKIDADGQKLCTIVFPWGEYKYKRLPMGIKIALFLMFSKFRVYACPRYGIC
jgi:hypothetical protein